MKSLYLIEHSAVLTRRRKPTPLLLRTKLIAGGEAGLQYFWCSSGACGNER